MQYKSFSIRNYRAIGKELTLDVSKNSLIPLVGMNECGKTTILQAIYCFDPVNDKENSGKHLLNTLNLYKTSDEPATISANIEISKNTFKTIINRLNEDIENGKLDKNIYNIVSFDELINRIPKMIEVNRDLNTKSFSIPVMKDLFGKETISRIGHEIVRYLPYILYNDDFNDRPVSIINIPLEETELTDWAAIYNRLFESTDENFSLYSLSQVEDARRRNTILSEVQEKLNDTLVKAWKTFSLDKKGSIGIKLEVIDETPKKLRVLVIEKIGNKEKFFEVNDRSKGFIWFYNFIMKTQYNPKADGTTGNTIFLLDEPGSYLHSTAQERLCEKLREISRKNGNIIYCTHSHHLLNPKYVPPKDILIVSKDDHKNITITPLPLVKTKIESKNALQPVYEALNLPDYELFSTDKKIILVEGIYDKYALELFCTLEKNIVIYPGTSADAIVKNMQQFIAYGKMFICLWDNDEEGIKNKKKALKVFGNEFEEICLSLPKGEKSKRRMEGMIDSSDYGNIKKGLSLSENANYETLISSLYYLPSNKKNEVLKLISERTRKNFDILKTMIIKAFLTYSSDRID